MNEQMELEFAAGNALEVPAGPPTATLLDALGESQLPIDFSAQNQAEGFKAWQEERLQRLARLARLWQLPLGKRVRVRLLARSEEPEGLLTLRQAPESFADRRAPLALRVAGVSFSSHEIESLVTVD